MSLFVKLCLRISPSPMALLLRRPPDALKETPPKWRRSDDTIDASLAVTCSPMASRKRDLGMIWERDSATNKKDGCTGDGCKALEAVMCAEEEAWEEGGIGE